MAKILEIKSHVIVFIDLNCCSSNFPVLAISDSSDVCYLSVLCLCALSVLRRRGSVHLSQLALEGCSSRCGDTFCAHVQILGRSDAVCWCSAISKVRFSKIFSNLEKLDLVPAFLLTLAFLPLKVPDQSMLKRFH